MWPLGVDTFHNVKMQGVPLRPAFLTITPLCETTWAWVATTCSCATMAAVGPAFWGCTRTITVVLFLMFLFVFFLLFQHVQLLVHRLRLLGPR